jgi:hypothetical protein
VAASKPARRERCSSGATWLNDSRRLLFASQKKLYLIDRQSRRIRELMSLTDEDPSAPAVTRDNKWVYFHRHRNEADIWMATFKR